jgi:two-component system NtrC family response regulator
MNNSAGAEQKVKTVDSRGPGELSRESFPTLKDFRSRILNEVESSYLKDLIQVADGDIPTACQISGLSRPRLYALLKQYGVDRHSRGQGY